MPAIDLSILNQRQTPAFYADVFANRPAAGFVGRIFVSTNTFAFYRDNGTSWDLIGGPGTGTITGSGAAGQVSFWNGASTITGSNDLFWDNVNGHLGVGTVTPGTALDVKHDQSTVVQLEQITATNDIRIAFINNGVGLWRLGAFYNAGANDFGLFDIAAATQPVTVKRTTGQVLIGTSTVGSGKLVVANTNGDSHIQIVGASAPSLRIDSAESGPTKRAGFGISTSTNNFIQGSADRDFCMFNGSTTASPILFGIYDAAAVNVQEAARISAARNFLIGTTTDSGEKLQVTGSGRLKLSSDRNLAFKFDSQNTISSQSDSGAPESLRIYADTFRLFTATTAIGLTERLSITNGGNFGFNTATPLVPYHFAFRQGEGDPTVFTGERMRLQGNDNNGRSNYFTIISGSNAYGGLYVGDNGSGEIGKIRYYNLNNSWEFHSNNALAMTISNAQNLLIGTTTDNGNRVNVNGNIWGNAIVRGDRFVSNASFTANIVFNTFTTFYTMTATFGGMYLVIVCLDGQNTADWAASAIIYTNGSSSTILTQQNGTLVSIQTSGLDIQARQTGTSPNLDMSYRILKISNV